MLKGGNQKKKNNRGKHVLEGVQKGGFGVGVVSCREEDNRGVVRMKIVVRKSELKQFVEVINGAHKSSSLSSLNVSNLSSSSVEQRLNNLLRKKYVSSRAKPALNNTGNTHNHKCWSPVLQSIPEEL
ncbi:hypothetical protein RJT34_25661 [Clitoria ternatea]|uniref:Uncharacterized protein n=1 Tax=Clitoria ternatea TaxID=43366 RepID=A0AAN9FT61_CLITE